MFLLPTSVRIYLACEPCDMRKGFDGLATLVSHMGQDVFDGHLYVFLSKRRDRCKILTWHNGGFVLWYKRFEKGRFKRPQVTHGATCASLDGPSLAMLLEGIDTTKVQRPALWRPKCDDRDRHRSPDVIQGRHVSHQCGIDGQPGSGAA